MATVPQPLDQAELEAYLNAAAGLLELPVAPENWPGVRENFARIAAFARLTAGLQLAYVDLPAPVFEPESRK